MEEENFEFSLNKKCWIDFLINVAIQKNIEKPKEFAIMILDWYESKIRANEITDSTEDFVKFVGWILRKD